MEEINMHAFVRFANLYCILVAFGLLLVTAVAYSAPAFEPNTFYSYRTGDSITRTTGLVNASGATAKAGDNSYLVLIKNDLSEPMRNAVLRHENCHVQQLKEGRAPSEEECELRMWFP